MKWLDKLERKYGKYAIPNLMYYVIILYIVGFVINIVAPELYTEYLGSGCAGNSSWSDLENFYFYYSACRTAVTFLSCLHCICII